MKSKYLLPLLLSAVCGFLIAYLFFSKTPESSETSATTILLRDTIYVQLKPRNIEIKAKPNLNYLKRKINDSSKAKPEIAGDEFVASLDTIVANDSISLSYRYPANLLSLRISSMPDSIPQYFVNIYSEKPKNSTNIWLERVALFSFGLGLGALLSQGR